MKKFLLTLVMIAAMVNTVSSQEIKLFKEYTYGLSQAEVQKKSKAKICGEGFPDNILCGPKQVSFADLQWWQVFSFEGGALRQVMLFKKQFNPSSFSYITNTIKNNKFLLVAMAADDDHLDLIEIRLQDSEVANTKLKNLLAKEGSAKKVTYAFCEETPITPLISDKNIHNLSELLYNSSPFLRVVEVSKTNDSIVINFFIRLSYLAGKKETF